MGRLALSIFDKYLQNVNGMVVGGGLTECQISSIHLCATAPIPHSLYIQMTSHPCCRLRHGWRVPPGRVRSLGVALNPCMGRFGARR